VADDPAKANRQMVAERQALLAENARLKQTIAQRSVDITTAFIDGLDVLLAQATRGDAGAVAVLSKLAVQLEQLQAARSRLVVANGKLS
jgi:hypothetical protein